MTEKIFDIIKMVIAIIPFVMLCFSAKKANAEKSQRYKQFFMPVVAVIYIIAGMFLAKHVDEWLINFINSIPGKISSLASFTWIPEAVGSVIVDIANMVRNFIEGLDMNYWVFYATNVFLLTVYMVVKKIIVSLSLKIFKDDPSSCIMVAEKFYEFFPERGKWCLKENYVQARTLLKTLFYCAVFVSSILMIVSHKFYHDGRLEAMFYPVFGVITVGELFYYLDGLTKREYCGNILGEDEDAYKVVNYSLLRKFLRSVFGDKLLAENTSVNNSLSYELTTDDIIREFENDEDQKIQSFATYVDMLNKTGFDIDHNYLYSSRDMLNGKSILFNNPFYNDLIPYAFYPMNRNLLSHKKVLIVLGRHSIENDIISWVEKGIEAVTNIPFLWNVGVLNADGEYDSELDVGIVTRSDVLNIKLHEANTDFLENVGFFVVIEPSKLISTAQIGLNLLVKKCRKEDEDIVYCLCDKNCDGLVDAMSHVLMTSITEVSATKKPRGTSSYMCWEADEDYLHHRLVPNISRYLGIGTELSFAALKNQVSKTKWYGGESFPVVDLRWIAKQYYYDLTKYAGISTSQDAMDDSFETTSNFWSAEVDKNSYLTVEDESFNMFEILREFSTRTTEQGFVNVISSDYLLKDYMADNSSIFEADAKAVPFIVSDYTRSNRNTVLRIILMMSTFPVKEEILEKELSLLGITAFEIEKQLWYEMYKCFSTAAEITALPQNYKEAVYLTYDKPIKQGNGEWESSIIRTTDTFNLKNGKIEKNYYINDKTFFNLCVAPLRSAGYVAEDEKGQAYYLGSELAGHIYQKYLPGQFFTFGGKYYEMQYLTADGQILVRRAADHINGRPSYRQMREYVIRGTMPSEKIGAQQNISGMRVVKEFADILVKTPGYYRMSKYNDFSTAKKISFEGEKSGIPERVYCNKEIIKIELPELDGKLNDNVRYTITVLFNEIFRTIFAENQPYICAVTDNTFIENSEDAELLTYSIKGENCEISKNAIYIIEDSQLDLGLTVAVERNLERIFGIIHDYINWHNETLEESLNPSPDPTGPVSFTEVPVGEPKEPEAKGLKKILAKLRKMFGKGKKADGTAEGGDKDPSANPQTPEGEKEEPEKKGIFGIFKRRKKRKKGEDDVPAADGENTGDNEPAPEAPEVDYEESQPEPEAPEAEEENGDSSVEPEEDAEIPEPEIPLFIPSYEEESVITDETEAEEADAQPEGEKTEAETVDEPVITQETEEPAESEAVEAEESDDADTEEASSSEPVALQEFPAENEISDSVEQEPEIGFKNKRKPYHERYYMLYGRESELPFIDLSGTLDYLTDIGVKNNALKQAREGKKIAKLVETTFRPGKPDARYCDFCGAEIYGVEYETLADGRDRCVSCGRTAIKTGEEFRKIFEDVRRNMESFFGIRINVGIRVEMVNSKTLHKRLGKAFIPTPKTDGRVLGVAIKDKSGYTLMIENGSPRMASMLTMAHELTHIWQYVNWNDKAVKKKYGKNMRLEIYEGMAKWVEIQYAYLINEPAVAKREEILTSYREDEYGYGFLRYRANYPFSTGTVITKPTPFMNVETPLAPEYCGTISVKLPVIPTGYVDPDGEGGNGDDTDPAPQPEPIQGTIERNPDDYAKYAYNLLNDAQKPVYDLMYEAIMNMNTEVSSFEYPIVDSEVQKIVDYVQRDHPEMFWFQHGATYYYDKETRIVSRIELRYCMSAEERELREDKIEKEISPFLTSINNSMSDYEVTLHLYENIIKLVDYDTIGLERQKKTTVTPDVPDDLRSIYGVFVNKKAVCAGYAKAMQYLLNLCGIECLYVTSDTHAWNIVKLEGDYYHLDVTWGDGTDTKKEKVQSDAVNYDCFCLTTKEVLQLKSHVPEKDFEVPECTATKCNYHRRNGLYFENYDIDKIRNVITEKVKLGKIDISIRFETNSAFREAKKELIDKSKLRELIQYASLKAKVKLDSSYMYSLNDDRKAIAFYLKKH